MMSSPRIANSVTCGCGNQRLALIFEAPEPFAREEDFLATDEEDGASIGLLRRTVLPGATKTWQTNCESRNTRWIWWWVTWRCSGLPTPRAALPIQPQSARGNSDDQDRRATCTARSKSPRPRWRELQPPKVAAHLRLFLPCAASSPWVSSAPCRRAPVSSILFCQIPFGFDKSPGRSLLGLWS